MKTVYVGMSGGVDSSVAALLLLEQGYRVVGVYMKNWSRDLPGMKCPWAEDLADAKRVAVKLGIDFEVWDFEKEYHDKVVEYMLSEFRAGNTPNPDIMCNQEIKFKLFYEKAMAAGADYIATGHYARVVRGLAEPIPSGAGLEFSSTSYAGTPREPSLRDEPLNRRSPAGRRLDTERKRSVFSASTVVGSVRNIRVENSNQTFTHPREIGSATRPASLMRAVDENKDQTYFLYRISEEALAHTLFPIGKMLKPEVKKLAKEKGLHNAYKKESMGVCFVGEVGMRDFLKEYIDIKPGEIREIETDKVLGYHEGAVFYTVGQRHGLYVPADMPYYVVKKDIEKNVLYVSKNLNDSNLWTDELTLRDIIMRTRPILPEAGLEFSSTSYTGAPREPSLRDEPLGHVRNIRVENSNQNFTPPKERVLVRLRHRAPLVQARFDGEKLYFEHKIKRPAAGQSAVLYDGEVCLGGGIIQ